MMTGEMKLKLAQELEDRIPDVPGCERIRISVSVQIGSKRSTVTLRVPNRRELLEGMSVPFDAEPEIVAAMTEDLKAALRLALADVMMEQDRE